MAEKQEGVTVAYDESQRQEEGSKPNHIETGGWLVVVGLDGRCAVGYGGCRNSNLFAKEWEKRRFRVGDCRYDGKIACGAPHRVK